MSLLTYSGMTTKVRAMESRLITEEQFREMASLEDVRSAADYLRQLPAYKDIFSNLDDTKLHRGNIEQLLAQSEYRDFSRLYGFANQKQKQFLQLLFLHYEVDILKRILRNVTSRNPAALDLSLFQPLFKRHGSIDLMRLCHTRSLEEFLAALDGTPYRKLFPEHGSSAQVPLAEYEVRLDLFYYSSIWKLRAKSLSRQDRKLLDQCFGSQLDLLNLQWIYRCKKYYRLPAADIYALLIPVYYRLQKEQTARLVEAAGPEEFLKILQTTHYGRLPDHAFGAMPDPEALSRQTLTRLYGKAGRKYPYSPAILDSYFYFKELEMHRIITTIEGIRYGLDASAIFALAKKQ